MALPGALVVYTAFRGGGFFAGTQGALAAGFAVLLALRAILARDPLAGATRALAVAAAALGLLGIWVLISSAWSHSTARALIEFDRVLLYLLTLAFFGSLPMTIGRLRWMVRGVALGALVVCAAALASKTLPDLWPISFEQQRLAYPITYSNALGMLGALGIILSLHMTSSGREAPAIRVLAAAGPPIFASAVLLTFSRAAMVAGALGLVTYVMLARPRLLLTGLLGVVPATIAAVVATYRADALSEATAAAAVAAQGSHVARVIALGALAAALGRGLLLPVDVMVMRRRSPWLPRPVATGVVAVSIAVAAGAFVATGAPGHLKQQYRQFVDRPVVRETGDARDRLLDPSGSGRADFWRLAIRASRTEPLHGHGAGTYQLLWQRNSPYGFQLVDGHSLYLEALAELGAVGLALIVVAVLTLLWGIARRIWGPDRSLFAVVFAASAAWALRAGIEWDWEMPVVTLSIFALGGATLATPVPPRDHERPARTPAPAARLAAAIACLFLAVLPAQVALSQHRLNSSVQAFKRDDCARAIDRALDALDAAGFRPEPYELIGYCDLRLGLYSSAVRAMGSAVRLDPQYWQYHYGLAAARGMAGLDPRPEARRALELNPREALPQRLSTAPPRLWQVEARRALLPST